jgi:hypothetical protein
MSSGSLSADGVTVDARRRDSVKRVLGFVQILADA